MTQAIENDDLKNKLENKLTEELQNLLHNDGEVEITKLKEYVDEDGNGQQRYTWDARITGQSLLYVSELSRQPKMPIQSITAKESKVFEVDGVFDLKEMVV